MRFRVPDDSIAVPARQRHRLKMQRHAKEPSRPRRIIARSSGEAPRVASSEPQLRGFSRPKEAPPFQVIFLLQREAKLHAT
jgi:hypothetical protein